MSKNQKPFELIEFPEGSGNFSYGDPDIHEAIVSIINGRKRREQEELLKDLKREKLISAVLLSRKNQPKPVKLSRKERRLLERIERKGSRLDKNGGEKLS